MAGSPLDRLARNIKRGGDPAWVPRIQGTTSYLGNVTDVDLFKGTVGFAFNDPSGLVLPRVRFLQTYSADRPPSAGDVVWVQHSGTDLMVLGQHYVPIDIVTL